MCVLGGVMLQRQVCEAMMGGNIQMQRDGLTRQVATVDICEHKPAPFF